MPKNKNQPNAFYYFMIDWKTQEEKKGRRFPNGLKDVQRDPICNETWRNLSEEDKNFYKSKQKNFKECKDKKTGVGESICEVERIQMLEKKFLDDMRSYISTTIDEAHKTNDAQNLRFNVIHVNYFYKRVLGNNSVMYYPAEIAIAKFSLKEGVVQTYHKIIKSEIVIGYTSEAITHSMNTHQIPKDHDFDQSSHYDIYLEIRQFLEPEMKNGKLPPLYTWFAMDDIKLPVVSVLERLSCSDENIDQHFTVYSFEDLFVKLKNLNSSNYCAVMFDSIVASMKLKEDQFDYKSSIQCEFHQLTHGAGNYCSKSYAQRWVFTLCFYTCPDFSISFIPGKHVPSEKNISEDRMSELEGSFKNVKIKSSKMSSSTPSGVVKNYIKHASERTYEDEQRRRAESLRSGPLEIIDYSKLDELPQEPVERPLRPPHTRPAAFDQNKATGSSYEDNFPSIGRGSRKKMTHKSKSGNNYASMFKK